MKKSKSSEIKEIEVPVATNMNLVLDVLNVKEFKTFCDNVDTFLRFITSELLTHEQHIKYEAKRKEVFGE